MQSMWMDKIGKQMNIVLLGTGFIGQSLKNALQHIGTIYTFNSQQCNLLKYTNIEMSLSTIAPIDVIIFTAVINRHKDNSLDAQEKNIKMVNNIATFILQHKIQHVIFFSSIDIFGFSPSLPIRENTPIKPEDNYAQYKYVAEQILSTTCQKAKTSLFIARLPGVFGPLDKQQSTISKLINSIIQNKLILENMGSAKRDFVHISYLEDIVKQAMNIRYNGTINVATGISYTIYDISKIIFQLLDKQICYQNQEITTTRQQDIIINIDKLRKDLLIQHNIQKLDYYIQKQIKVILGK